MTNEATNTTSITAIKTHLRVLRLVMKRLVNSPAQKKNPAPLVTLGQRAPAIHTHAANRPGVPVARNQNSNRTLGPQVPKPKAASAPLLQSPAVPHGPAKCGPQSKGNVQRSVQRQSKLQNKVVQRHTLTRQANTSVRQNVVQLNRYYSSGLKDIYQKRNGKYKSDSAIYLVNADGDHAFVSYIYEGNTVIVPHVDALNMANGSGVSYLLLNILAAEAKAAGKTHMALGTAVFKGPAGHVYNQLGFDTSSAEALSRDRVALSDIVAKSANKILGRWSIATAFDEVYVDDRRKRARGEPLKLTSFPKIE